ncbi:MAG TPA: hypothetical protein VHY34_05560 [Caulobacteraceae bacterium]|jgi:hypothetical protein|nr:hypothetical protein [Caulobacteraceae bacterium]
MSARHLPLTLAVGSILVGGAILSGCGKTGQLEQPAPMFGEQAKAQYAADKKAQADATARRNAARKAQQTGPIVDDPDSQPAPTGPYNPPNPGHVSDPFMTAPQGSLPQPGTAPDR